MGTGETAASWDAQYAAGRYLGAPPVPFTRDIIAAAAERGLTGGLYIGCGNGRNLLPMLAAGLDLTGLDISAEAISQLRRRRPDLAGRLVTGELTALPPPRRQLHRPLPGRAQDRAGHPFLRRGGTGRADRGRVHAGPSAAAGPDLAGAARGRPVVAMGSHLAAL